MSDPKHLNRTYAVYELATGRILRSISCTPEAAAMSYGPGQGVVQISPNTSDATHYIADGQTVPFPPRPSAAHKWSWETKTWQADLAEARAAKWQQVKAQRRRAIEEPLATPLGTFDADAESQEAITRTALLAHIASGQGNPVTEEFTLADNTVVTLTAGQLLQVAQQLRERNAKARARANQLRAAIAAARTVQEIEAVTWAP